MASIQYTVWTTAAEVANGPVVNEDSVTIGGTSTQSPTVMDPNGGNVSRRVRLFADTACFVTWGENPTATGDFEGGRALGSENPEYWEIRADYLIAVIERT